MSIALTWKNNNEQSVVVKIYRSDTEIDRENLPESIATLSNGEVRFVDDTAVQGNTYYYVFETIGPKDRVVSRNYELQATETRGIGSNTFKFGDRAMGLYDIIPADSIANWTALIAAAGLTGTTAVTFTSWYKLARNGKVYYVPNRQVARNVSWDALKAAGAVDGTLQIEVGGFTFKLYLPTGWSDSDLPFPTGATDMDTLDNVCEFNDLIYPLFKYMPNKQTTPNWAQQSNTDTNLNTAPVILCRETSEGNVITRGANADARTAITTVGTVASSTTVGTQAWWPILELVEA